MQSPKGALADQGAAAAVITAGTMAAYITGLQDSNKAVQNMPLTNVTLGANAPKINFAGRWGITAATGGAHAGVNVARVRIVTPMAAPGSLTAGE